MHRFNIVVAADTPHGNRRKKEGISFYKKIVVSKLFAGLLCSFLKHNALSKLEFLIKLK
jgi:hypothetical protein